MLTAPDRASQPRTARVAAVPATDPPTDRESIDEAACRALVEPPSGNTTQLAFKDARMGTLDSYTRVARQLATCAPFLRNAPAPVQQQTADLLDQLRVGVEGWYLTSPALRSAELTAMALQVTTARGVGISADRRDVAQAFVALTHAFDGFPGREAKASGLRSQRELGVLMLTTDALAGALLVDLENRKSADELRPLLAAYTGAIDDEAAGWAASANEQAGHALLAPSRPMARNAIGSDGGFAADHLKFVDMALSDRLDRIQHQASLLGSSWIDRPNATYRGILGTTFSKYFDVLASMPGGEGITTRYLVALPGMDGEALVPSGKLVWLALLGRSFRSDFRTLFEAATAEAKWGALLAVTPPRGGSISPAYADDLDLRARGALQAVLQAVTHAADPDLQVSIVADMALRLDLQYEQPQQVGAGVPSMATAIRNRLSRAFAESALCITDAALRGSSSTVCDAPATDPKRTASCAARPTALPSLLKDGLQGRPRDGLQRILQVLAYQAELAADSPSTVAAPSVGWTKQTRCALELLADAGIYRRLGFGTAGDVAMLRTVAVVGLHASEPSIRAVAQAAFKHAQADMRASCAAAGVEVCEETSLAAALKSPAPRRASRATEAEVERQRLRAAHGAFCDSAVLGSYAYGALTRARPAHAPSVAQRYWNAVLPPHLENSGSALTAEANACLAGEPYSEYATASAKSRKTAQ